MSRRILGVIGVLASLAVPTAMAFVYGPGMMRAWKKPREPIPPDTRTPAEKLAERHSLQLKMLTQHRALFEAAVRDEPGKREELHATVEGVAVSAGPPYLFEWRVGRGHFSYSYKLLYCPNGEKELPDNFWHSHIDYSQPMKIDDHWFAAFEPSG